MMPKGLFGPLVGGTTPSIVQKPKLVLCNKQHTLDESDLWQGVPFRRGCDIAFGQSGRYTNRRHSRGLLAIGGSPTGAVWTLQREDAEQSP